jgi:hypothetical protein
MSDVPPVPEAAAPPFPAQPEPVAKPGADIPVAKKAKTKAEKKPKPEPKAKKPKAEGEKSNVGKYAAGAAIGIGSAAIVAALLFTNRNKKS